MKIIGFVVVFLIVTPSIFINVSSVKGNHILDEILGLERTNAIYLLIRNTTWGIRGEQILQLPKLCSIRTNAETTIGLMTLLPYRNPILFLHLSNLIFLLAIIFNKEDNGNFQNVFDLYNEMMLNIIKGVKEI